MGNLFVRRLAAFFIDYMVIILYALALFGVTMLIQKQTGENNSWSPITGQLIGLITLTIPVFLYFYLSEKSTRSGTLGKMWMSLTVVNASPNKKKNVFLRNIIKFIPWEIAHLGVHWMSYYSSNDLNPPVWVWMVLIVPQVMVLGYFISIVIKKGESSLYDRIANTSIEFTQA